MTDNPHELARVLGLIAASLDQRGADGSAYVLRRVAALLVCLPTPGVNDCPVCASPVGRPDRGRPRVYCSTRCRRRAEKQRRNDRMTA